MADWQWILELDEQRKARRGSPADLNAAIRRGADLRISTEFRHNEHIDVDSSDSGLVREVAEFRVTYLLDDCWSAGIMTLRQPIELPHGFGPRPSMSFFLYNQDGQQAIARPYLDGGTTPEASAPASTDDSLRGMPRYHAQENWDATTNAPSSNFVYEFDVFRYGVRDDWREVLAHGPDGVVSGGGLKALADAFSEGCEIKVAVRDLCDDLSPPGEGTVDHELFVQTNSAYHYVRDGFLLAGTQPLVRVRPAVPLLYKSHGWDFGWLVVRTDGFVSSLLYDPYTLAVRRTEGHHAVRWFVR